MIQVHTPRGDAQVIQAVRRFADLTGRGLADEMVATGRLVAVALAHSTQPYGKGKDVQETAEKRVASDIRKIFRSPSSVFRELMEDDESEAKAFWAAFRAGDEGRMQDIMIRSGIRLPISDVPDYGMHQGARNIRGRVRGKDLLLVKNNQALQKYIKERQKMVGFAKAGWARAADTCGGHRGIMAWASSRHPGAAGGARVIRDPYRPRVILYNTTRYIHQVLPAPEIQTAVGIAYDRLYKRLKIVIAKNARKAA